MSTSIGQIRRHFLTATAIIPGLVMLAVGCGGSAAPSTSASTGGGATPSTVASTKSATGPFPSTLLGLPWNNSGDARQLASSMVGPMTTMHMLVHPQVGVYGGQSNLLVVVLSGVSATAKKYGGADLSHPSAAGLRRSFLIMGFTDVQTFPPGATRASMVCGKLVNNGIGFIFCERTTNTGIGMTMFINGIASSASDAASKTNQILSQVGG